MTAASASDSQHRQQQQLADYVADGASMRFCTTGWVSMQYSRQGFRNKGSIKATRGPFPTVPDSRLLFAFTTTQ